jgi:hypothetical protein
MKVKIITFLSVALVSVTGCQTTQMEEPELDSRAITQASKLGEALGTTKYCFAVPEEYTKEDTAKYEMALHHSLQRLINKHGNKNTIVNVANESARNKLSENLKVDFNQALQLCRLWEPYLIQQVNLSNQAPVQQAPVQQAPVQQAPVQQSKTVQCYKMLDLSISMSKEIKTFKGNFCPFGWWEL